MSDELPRSTQGNRPDQRRQGDAPTWWADLTRSDLPEDEVKLRRGRGSTSLGRHVRATSLIAPSVKQQAAPSTADRVGSILLTISVLLVAAVVAWIGIGAGSGRSMLIVGVLFGIPTALAAIAVTLVMRRSD
jgi:hypothetical protein